MTIRGSDECRTNLDRDRTIRAKTIIIEAPRNGRKYMENVDRLVVWSLGPDLSRRGAWTSLGGCRAGVFARRAFVRRQSGADGGIGVGRDTRWL